MLTSTIISLFWIAFLIAIFLFFLNQYLLLRKIAQWPVTEGTVVKFVIKEDNKTYWPSISYQYQVDGHTHESKHFFADTTHNTPQTPSAKRLAYNTAQAYLKEKPVIVHYNPQAPEEAVLDVKVPTKLIVILAVLVSLIIAEVFVLLT